MSKGHAQQQVNEGKYFYDMQDELIELEVQRCNEAMIIVTSCMGSPPLRR
jgi:hypothetical protein